MTILGGVRPCVRVYTDNRDAFGEGALQLVTPTLADLGGLGSLAALATLTINYGIPEPGTALLLGAGLGALGLLARRNS